MNCPYCNKEMGHAIASMKQCLSCYGEPMIVSWDTDKNVPIMNIHMGVTFVIRENDINYYINYSPTDGHTVIMCLWLNRPISKSASSPMKQLAEFYSTEIIMPSNVKEYFDRIFKLLAFM